MCQGKGSNLSRFLFVKMKNKRKIEICTYLTLKSGSIVHLHNENFYFFQNVILIVDTIHLIDFRRANEPELVSNERWHPERNLNEKK
jgi:hypothetical protein